MNTAKRKEGFLLPLAILCILVVSMVALNGFGFIQQHTNQLSYKKDTLNIQEQKNQLMLIADSKWNSRQEAIYLMGDR